jgi:hypothetical protein
MTVDRTVQSTSFLVLQVLLSLGLAVWPALRAPVASITTSPLSNPVAPLEEEEEKRGEGQSAVSTASQPRRQRTVPNRPAHPVVETRFTGLPASLVLLRPAHLDPFRNGLGTPFRC